LVTVDREETRVAILEAAKDAPSGTGRRGRRRRGGPELASGYRASEIYFERRGNRSIVGNIYKGVVDNVLPGLEAAFVDIGLEKNGFLHVDEIVLPGVERVQRGRGHGKGPSIVDLLKPGQEVVVQVIKDPLKTKGARLSMEVTIAGRYMVYTPTGEGVGVSRRLEDKERQRLRKEAAKLDMGGGGAIIRTAAHGAKREDFEREMQYLFKLAEVLEERVKTSKAPAMVFQEADLSVRVVRDIFSAHFERAVVDDPKQHHRLVSFFARTAPELVERVELWESDEPLFEAYGVEDVIEGMLSKRVDLPSGGYLMIDYAEALTVIDVNTGSFTGRGKAARLEDTITRTNLEAAEEVVNQLRLRDIGGIIVIDFIDMARARNRDAVLKTLRKSLDEDRTKTFVVEISPLGLVEMTRQNVTEGVREIMTKICPTCDGEGVVKSEETVAIEVDRQLRELVKQAGDNVAEAYLIRINPKVTAQFIGENARMLHALEADTGAFFSFEGSEGLPLDHFAVTLEGSREEVIAAAVPFSDGDEVHVHIVEPHMYEVDDAVAKIDGYIISVEGAGPFVGQKRLVRIEDAGRTSARAVLIDLTDDEAAKIEADKEAEAKRKRRGRRGGRARRKDTEVAGIDAASPEQVEAEVKASTGPAAEVESDGEEKPKRKRAPRKKAAAAPAASDDGEGPADEEAPKTGRSRARKKAAEPAEPEPEAAATPDEEADGDALDSKPRRRGRRGGRRRSRAKADDGGATEEVTETTE
jgi:ribonuclease G